MTDSKNFTIEQVYAKGKQELAVITDLTTGQQYLQTTIITASGSSVALTPLLKPSENK
ncbi:DUF6440 family protein [Enterococcus sp. AZ103]|uniref:DUF6440 family protein n=1 Tax=Enterococcus sp. AZ103 TaxID=2774628 RepID=UPI003F1EBC0A